MSVTPPNSSSKSTRRPRLTPHFKLRHTGEYLLRGILVIAPVCITVSFVYWVFSKLDSILHPLVIAPGLGFLLLSALVLVIGWISTFYVVKRTFRIVSQEIEYTPGISFMVPRYFRWVKANTYPKPRRVKPLIGFING